MSSPEQTTETQSDVLLTIRDACKSFGQHDVLKGVSLNIYAGEVVCIVGPSGSGKSTLLRSVNGLESIDHGAIHLGGVRIDKTIRGRKLYEPTEKERSLSRQKMGMVFQQFHLFAHMTAIENIMLAQRLVGHTTKDAAKTRAYDLLGQMGLQAKASFLPSQLSGGQQQRVAIARALAMRPELILFDEPTSALDPELVEDVLGVMKQLAAEGQTMLIVTHELGFARDVADRIVVMDDGHVIEEGPSRQVLSAPQNPRTQKFISSITSTWA